MGEDYDVSVRVVILCHLKHLRVCGKLHRAVSCAQVNSPVRRLESSPLQVSFITQRR